MSALISSPANGVRDASIRGNSSKNPTALSPVAAGILLSLPTLAALGALAPGLGSLFAFRIAVIGLGVVALLSKLFRPDPIVSSVNWLVGLWLAVILLFVVGMPLSGPGRIELSSLVVGLTLLWASSRFGNASGLARLIPRAWLIAYICTGLLALWELRSGRHLPNYYLTQDDLLVGRQQTALASTLGNPNNYAFFLCVATAFMLVSTLSSDHPWARFAYGAACASALPLLLGTGSRLGVVVWGCLVSIAFISSNRARKYAGGSLAVAALVVLLAGAPSTVATPIQAGVEQVRSAISNGSGGLHQELVSNGTMSAGARLNLVRNGWQFAVSSEFLGTGPAGFERSMLAREGSYPTGGIVNPHCGWLEILVQYGLVIVVLAGLLLLQIGHVAFRGWRSRELNTPREGYMSLMVGALVIVLPIASMMNSTFLQPSIVWACFSSLTLAATRISSACEDGVEREN